MSRRSKSLGLKTAERLGLTHTYGGGLAVILDSGCGRCGDVRALQDEGYDVTGYDPHLGDEAPYGCLNTPPVARGAYDLVLCTYVLNVLEDQPFRRAILRDAWSYVKPGGVLLVTVRSEADNTAKGWTSEGDGWRTPAGTFQHFFTDGEVVKLMSMACPKSYVRGLNARVTVAHKWGSKED
jgi:hypothetical protein